MLNDNDFIQNMTRHFGRATILLRRMKRLWGLSFRG